MYGRGHDESEGNMKAQEMTTMLQFMRLLNDEALDLVADARFKTEPRDYTDKVLMQFAAGEREWRKECTT
jgi:cytochrome c oxidase assembly factor CtaG